MYFLSKHTKKITTFLVITIFVVVSSVLFTYTNQKVDAYGNFGGQTLSAKYCSCSAGCWKLYIGDPKGGWFMWCPWTRFYAHYNIMPNAWQLGLYSTWMACLQVTWHGCRYDGGGYLMYMDGTSP
jgi:hypothetical protein